MAQYIDKSALVAEIERRIKNLYPKEGQGMVVTKILKDHYEDLLSFIDTLVKEVDFEKELDSIWFDNKFGNLFDNSAVDYTNVREICKYFFELGMSVGNKAQKGEKV